MEFEIVEIESIECIENGFYEEYVYDIEVDDDNHTFIANGVLVHNSLYIGHEKLLRSIDIYDTLTYEQKSNIVVDIHKKFLDQANNQHMSQYFKDFRGTRDCIHEFELETIASRGVWLNVKKRYAQSLAWKDGKFYPQEEQPIKSKGLEVVKASYPQLSRDFLKKFLTEILQNTQLKTKMDIFTRLNELNIQFKKKWEEQAKNVETMDNICPTTSVNNYTKYVSGTHKDLPIPSIESKCPAQVKGLAIYNWLREKYNLKGDPIYGGKMRTYIIKNNSNLKGWNFTYPSNNYPKWAFKYAPMDVNRMYEKCVIDPINRILEPIGVRCLRSDGSFQTNLFDFL